MHYFTRKLELVSTTLWLIVGTKLCLHPFRDFRNILDHWVSPNSNLLPFHLKWRENVLKEGKLLNILRQLVKTAYSFLLNDLDLSAKITFSSICDQQSANHKHSRTVICKNNWKIYLLFPRNPVLTEILKKGSDLLEVGIYE